MALPAAVEREKKHHRKIDCEGFLRADGLWDIEAHLVDTRSFDCSYDESHRGGVIPAGEPVHDMWMRLTIDFEFRIHDVQATSVQTPFPVCPGAAASMRKMIGLRIAPGWRSQVRERIGRVESCTHLMDLLGQMTATAYQTLHHALEERESRREPRGRPAILDTCMALSSSGETVRKHWPEFYVAELGTEPKS